MTDFILLNKSVIPGRYPLPLPEEIFQKTRDSSSFFSKLDLIKGYHQIELHTDSRSLTAMLLPLSFHQHKHMPLRLMDSGASLSAALRR